MPEDERSGVPNAMTTEELERTMRTLEPVYDIVRIVDPSPMEGRTLNECGTLADPHTCHAILDKGRRCHNCISARTISAKKSVSKFEVVGSETYYISTRYIVVDGEPRSLELIRRITNDFDLESADTDPAKEALRNAMIDDSQRRYLDNLTGINDERYLREGIADLQGSRVALLELSNISSMPKQSHDELMGCTAKAIKSSIRDKDTVIRLDDDSIAIIFEGIPQHLMRNRLESIRQHVMDSVARELDTASTTVIIGAVTGTGTIGELIDKARSELQTARTIAHHISLAGSDGEVPVQKAPSELPQGGFITRDVDALTSLPLPAAFRQGLQRRIEGLNCEAANGPGRKNALYVVHIDVENFKAYNRTYGMPAGDNLLVQLTSAIRDKFPNDLMTRTGIDMFDVATRTVDVRKRLLSLHGFVDSLRRETPLVLKAGIYEIADHEMAANQAMDRAKIACDSIKGKYDLTVRYYDAALQRRVNMLDHIVESLDVAIENNYIRPYYQAIVRNFTGKACAAEALSRWVDPVYGIISPVEVIPILEERHLIHKHDIHIVRSVCRDLRKLMDEGRAVVPVSINLSRLDFQLCDIFQEVENARIQYGISRSLIDIEVTESALDLGSSEFSQRVERFRLAGYDMWMDDFGSGYSSLNLLKDYEFDVLKIDREFLRELESSPTSQEILAAVVDMAKRIGVRTLVEGVETESQLSFLRGIGVEMIQGFLFSHPLPLESIDLEATLGVETPEERVYQNVVGHVNLLSQQSAQAINPVPVCGSRGTPLAILERGEDGRFRFLSANESYLLHLCNDGFEGIRNVERHINGRPELLQLFSGAFDRYCTNKREHTVHFQMDGIKYYYDIQFVARDGETAAYIICPHEH